MSLVAARVLSQRSVVPLPSNITVRDRYWYVHKGARSGWSVVRARYGGIPVNESLRRKNWEEWWRREGRFQDHPIISVATPIKYPRFSRRLAEFVGIMMGDGGISRFQVTITLDSETDRLYSRFVQSLIEDLFGVPVARAAREGQRAVSLTVSRVQLVRYCRDRLGLKVGNKLKQGLDFPDWVRRKSIYRLACVRGLMDTDGCIFNECHQINRKRYCYPRVSFSSASPKLCSSVASVLHGIGLKPIIRAKRKVQLENLADILDYFRLVGTNNPKHRTRFKRFTGGVEQLVALRS